MTSHHERPISIWNVAELFEQAFANSFTTENINSIFRATGIHLFNTDKFTDDMFLPPVVTNISQQPEENSIVMDAISSTQAPGNHETVEGEIFLRTHGRRKGGRGS